MKECSVRLLSQLDKSSDLPLVAFPTRNGGAGRGYQTELGSFDNPWVVKPHLRPSWPMGCRHIALICKSYMKLGWQKSPSVAGLAPDRNDDSNWLTMKTRVFVKRMARGKVLLTIDTYRAGIARV